MQDMDDICGWPGPVTLACNRLLSPPQLCAAETILSNPTGNISDGVPLGDMYSASSSCTWTINTPEQMYITLNFTKFHTEQLYDVVTIEVSLGRHLSMTVSNLVLTGVNQLDTGIVRCCSGFVAMQRMVLSLAVGKHMT